MIWGLLLAALYSHPSNAQLVQEGRSALRESVDQVDEWLGGTRADDNRSSSTIRLRTTNETRHGQRLLNPEYHASFSLKIGKIQAWQDEINHWVKERFDHYKNELYTKKDETPIPAPTTRTSQMRQAPPTAERDPWRFTLEKHLAVKIHPSWHIQPRARKDYEFDHVITSFAAQAGYSSATKWGSQVSLSATTLLAPRWTASLGNSAGWAISQKKFSNSHGLSLAYLPGDRQVMIAGVDAGMTIIDRAWGIASYSVFSQYRFSLWKELMFASINPFLDFARDHRFRGDPGIRASVEFVL